MSADIAPASSGTPRALLRAGGSARTDEDLYAKVVRAWCRMLTGKERRKHPLHRYVFGPDFARSVSSSRVGTDIALVCARLACKYPAPNAGAERVLEGAGGERPAQEAFDPVLAWWYPLDASRGLHYWELGNGIIEFMSVGPRADHPRLDGPR